MKYSLIALAATAICGASAASHNHRRHNHADIFKRYDKSAEACSCTTYVTSYVVPVTVYPSATVTVVPVYESEASTPEAPTYETPTYVKGVPEETPTYAVPEKETPTYVAPEETPTYVVPEKETPVYEDVTTTYVTEYETTTAVEYVTRTKPHEVVPTPDYHTYPTPGTYTIPAKTVVVTATETGVYPETTVLVPGCTTYGGVTTIIETSTVVTCPYVSVETTGGTTVSKVYETVYECPTPGTYTIGASTTTASETTTVTYGIPTEYPPGTYVQPEVTTTITKTNVVVTCPYEPYQPTPTPAEPEYKAPEAKEPEYETPVDTYVPEKPTYVEEKPSSTYVHEEPTYTPEEPTYTPEEPTYTPKEPTYTPKEPTYTPKEPTKYTNTPAPEKTYTPKPSGGHGKYWAITYSPFADNRGCKDPKEVAAEIADIASKGISNVRIYSTECDSLASVGDACRANGLGMIVGLFIKDGGISTCASQLEDLKKWNGWDMVKAVIVGNEAVFNKYVTAGELAAYMNTVREALRDDKDGPGYQGPVSTAETVNILEQNSNALCAAMDFVGVNIQPYFDGGRTADEAGDFLKSQLEIARNCCSGMEGYVLEAGWPSAGSPNNKAIASPENQRKAIGSFEAAAPGHVAYFTYRDDQWKEPGAFNIERSFGCGDVL